MKIAKPFGATAIVVSVLLIGLTFLQTDLFHSKLALLSASVSLLTLILSWYLIGLKKAKIAMITNGISIVLGVATLFLGLFPRVMVSSINPEYSLTIANASSSLYTLTLMTKVAIIFVPIVLAYQAWTYWIFRKRVTPKDIEY